MEKNSVFTDREEQIEEIRDINPDMLDMFTEDEIADCLIDIAKLLGPKNGKVVEYKLIKFSDMGNRDYYIKVSNTHGGFVSVSDDCNTGVSRTCFYPCYFDESDGLSISSLSDLLDMVNEAWCLISLQ